MYIINGSEIYKKRSSVIKKIDALSREERVLINKEANMNKVFNFISYIKIKRERRLIEKELFILYEEYDSEINKF